MMSLRAGLREKSGGLVGSDGETPSTGGSFESGSGLESFMLANLRVSFD